MKKYSILYIEDDDEDFDFFKNQLINSKRAYFDVENLEDYDNIDKKDFSKYDVIIVDYKLPTIDGISLMKKIKKLFKKNIPYIIFTGIKSEESDKLAILNGADDYIVKGETTDSLERAILYSIERKKILISLEEKNNFLEIIINSIESYIFVLNSNNEILVYNEKCKDFSDHSFIGHDLDSLLEFYPYYNDFFNLKTRDRIFIKNISKQEESKGQLRGIVEIKNGTRFSALIKINSIKHKNISYRIINIINNNYINEENSILRETTIKLENSLKNYGIEKANASAILDLVDNELEKIMKIEKV